MVRILHIIGSLNRGGAEAFLVNLYRNIDRQKVQFDFAIYCQPEENSYYDEVKSYGAKVFFVPAKTKGLIKNQTTIYKIVKHNHYDIVWRHTDGCFAGIDLISAKMAGANRLILHSHNTMNNGMEKYLHYLFRPIVNVVVTDRYACGKEAGIWLFKNRPFTVIRNGIEAECFAYNERTRKQYRERYHLEGKFVVGHVGRFHPAKNHEFIIKVFIKLYQSNKNTRLILVGTGATQKDIKDLVVELGIEDNVLFLEHRSDIAELMQAMDVFFMPSLFEGLPVTLVEAQGAGLPCVVSDNITRAIDISGKVKFVSLQADISQWVHELSSSIEENRGIGIDIVRAAGYDSALVAKQIEDEFI